MIEKACLALAVAAFSVLTTPQIPAQAQWEITFAQVEAAAGLSDLRTAGPRTFEARVMQRPWSAIAPMAFLRLTRVDGVATAQLFVFWQPARMAPEHRPLGADVTCRDGVCVRPIGIKDERDWGKVIADLASRDACVSDNDRNVTGFCADCDHVWIKTAVDGRYREQSCNAPGAGTLANSLLQLMKRSSVF